MTVKTRPGDNQTLHRAYELLRPGDILVVDGGGDLTQALVGEIMMSRARAIGVAGFVIDATGNWYLPFLMSMGLLLLGGFSAFLMHPERPFEETGGGVTAGKVVAAG